MSADQKEGADHSQSQPTNLKEVPTGFGEGDGKSERLELQLKTQDQTSFTGLFTELSEALLVDLQEYLQLLTDTDVAPSEKELFAAHKNDQKQAARIKSELYEIKSSKNNDNLVAKSLSYFKYWLAIYGGETTFDSYILVEKHPLWSSLKHLLTSAENSQYLSQEDRDSALAFYQNWQQSKEKAIDQELYQELGDKNEVRNSLIRDLSSPFGLKEFFVGSKSENGKARMARLLKKISKLSKNSEEQMSVLQDENLADSAKCMQWFELAQKQPKLKIPPEVKQVVSLIHQIEAFEVESTKRRKLHKKLALLQLVALAFPAIPKLIEYSESLAWQVVGLVPSELRMEAYSMILQQVYAFSPDNACQVPKTGRVFSEMS